MQPQRLRSTAANVPSNIRSGQAAPDGRRGVCRALCCRVCEANVLLEVWRAAPGPMGAGPTAARAIVVRNVICDASCCTLPCRGHGCARGIAGRRTGVRDPPPQGAHAMARRSGQLGIAPRSAGAAPSQPRAAAPSQPCAPGWQGTHELDLPTRLRPPSAFRPCAQRSPRVVAAPHGQPSEPLQ